MKNRYAAVIILTIVMLILVTCAHFREGFATGDDKAQAIVQWFTSNPSPSYSKYKSDLAESNIVEYEDALKLRSGGNLTVKSIGRVL
jgi:hypothetical protein